MSSEAELYHQVRLFEREFRRRLDEGPKFDGAIVSRFGLTWSQGGLTLSEKRHAKQPDYHGSPDRQDSGLRACEQAGLHSVEDDGEGQPMTDVGNRIVWFKRRTSRSVP